MDKIRQAILQAADQIELNPHTYHFHTSSKPDGFDIPGCMIGWMGKFAGVSRFGLFSTYMNRTAVKMGVTSFPRLLRKLTHIAGQHDLRMIYSHDAAQVLRIYADTYHPIPQATVNMLDWEEMAMQPICAEAGEVL